MSRLETALQQSKRLRVIGFDDAPFDKGTQEPVHVSGVVCSNTRFEGMLWFEVTRDGFDATDNLIAAVKNSKFFSQAHVLVTDGLAFGGFNILNLPNLHHHLKLPVIAVMRKLPDIRSIHEALEHLTQTERRKALIEVAGTIHQKSHFVFQAVGCSPEVAHQTLEQITDTGLVPEPLRLAHLIGSAVKTGQSGRRA